jgi:hypothetical protein
MPGGHLRCWEVPPKNNGAISGNNFHLIGNLYKKHLLTNGDTQVFLLNYHNGNLSKINLRQPHATKALAGVKTVK